MTSLQLSPGERAEIVVAVQPGDDVVLRSQNPDLSADFLVTRISGGHDSFDILRIVAADTLLPSTTLPVALRGVPESRALPTDTVPQRTFTLGDFTVNGLTMDHDRIDAFLQAGSSEVWEVRNGSLQLHNWHIHGARFRVLPTGDVPLPAYHQGWKDTVYIPPGDHVSLAVDFVPHPDQESPFMFHCHLLYHEDNGMMGQFILTDDPPRPGRAPESDHPHSHEGGD